MGEESLGIIELLDSTYSQLVNRHSPRELRFERSEFSDETTAISKIADDSDYHRTRIGYMYYENIGLFNLEGRVWAISRGKKGGSYPGDNYVGDIIALDLVLDGKPEEKIKEELSEKMGVGAYFMNTMLLGLRDGNLGIKRKAPYGVPTRFGERMVQLVSPRIKEFISQMPEYNPELLLVSTGQPVTTKTMLYKPETSVFLADCVKQVLRETN